MNFSRLISLTVAAAALAGCGSEIAGPEANIDAPSFGFASGAHQANGNGHVPFASGIREFTFHAKEQADGSAAGSYKIELTALDLFFEVEVSCMAVDGNTAWVAGHIRDSNAGFIEIGSVSYFYAIDNGEGAGSTPDVVSTARINDVAGEDLLFCADRPLILDSFPIQSGNVQVR
ncbi:MAG: hypothetical protein OEO23_09340 [Gemmatimonadota bacterium]|nr:hypothetical protein [Gemmatimonadota bacterium]